jgi:hypothetical protein
MICLNIMHARQLVSVHLRQLPNPWGQSSVIHLCVIKNQNEMQVTIRNVRETVGCQVNRNESSMITQQCHFTCRATVSFARRCATSPGRQQLQKYFPRAESRTIVEFLLCIGEDHIFAIVDTFRPALNTQY